MKLSATKNVFFVFFPSSKEHVGNRVKVKTSVLYSVLIISSLILGIFYDFL